MKDLAQWLLTHETHAGKAAGDGAAAFRICDKLRVSLGRLIGVAGFRALFSRAIALAGVDVPWLRGLHVGGDGTLVGLMELKSKLNDEQIANGEVVLVVKLLELVVTFIGPALTMQLVQQTWPEAVLDKFEF